MNDLLDQVPRVRAGQNPYDYLGDVATRTLTSLPRALGVEATVTRILENKFWKEFRQKFPDLVAELQDYKPHDSWVSSYYLHIEFVDMLRSKDHADQVREYAGILQVELPARAHTKHVILVIGPTPPGVSELRFSTDQDDRPMHAIVLHLDAVLYSKLSEEDRKSPVGRILGTIVYGTEDPAFIADGVRAAFEIEDVTLRQRMVRLVLLVAWARPALREAILRKHDEEANKMDEPTVEQVLTEDPVFSAIYENSEFFQSKLQQQKHAGEEIGEERGKKIGEHQTRVDSLVRAMASRKKPLSDEHIAKLKGMSCQQLPDLELAMEAESADDFARRAGLMGNGSGK